MRRSCSISSCPSRSRTAALIMSSRALTRQGRSTLRWAPRTLLLLILGSRLHYKKLMVSRANLAPLKLTCALTQWQLSCQSQIITHCSQAVFGLQVRRSCISFRPSIKRKNIGKRPFFTPRIILRWSRTAETPRTKWITQSHKGSFKPKIALRLYLNRLAHITWNLWLTLIHQIQLCQTGSKSRKLRR